MKISHFICPVARFIDDLLSFWSRPNFSIYMIETEFVVFCCCFFVLFLFFVCVVLLLFFKTVVPWLQKTRTDIHDADKTTSRLFNQMIKYPFSRYNNYDTFTCSWF